MPLKLVISSNFSMSVIQHLCEISGWFPIGLCPMFAFVLFCSFLFVPATKQSGVGMLNMNYSHLHYFHLTFISKHVLKIDGSNFWQQRQHVLNTETFRWRFIIYVTHINILTPPQRSTFLPYCSCLSKMDELLLLFTLSNLKIWSNFNLLTFNLE
jgi:hypothetical protein